MDQNYHFEYSARISARQIEKEMDMSFSRDLPTWNFRERKKKKKTLFEKWRPI